MSSILSPAVALEVARRKKEEEQSVLHWHELNEAVRLGVCPDCAGSMLPTGTMLQKAIDTLNGRDRKMCTTCRRVDFYQTPGD